MPKAPKKLLAAFDGIIPKLALELTIIEPDSDGGLLPLNSFIYEFGNPPRRNLHRPPAHVPHARGLKTHRV